MMMKSLANPNFPTMAALFHSTPLLSFKKRISWPQKYRHRGPPRLTFKLVWSPVSSGLLGKLNDASQTAWCWRSENDQRSQDNKKQNENKSSKSYNERSHDYSRQYENKSSNNIRSPDMTRERLALGLSANGPLNLEAVKTAYRSCALKWHPDHNQGFTKTFAEEKFKTCNAAYQSLCDKLSSS